MIRILSDSLRLAFALAVASLGLHAQSGIRAALIPVPVLGPDGAVSPELESEYVFMRYDGTYVASYPSRLETTIAAGAAPGRKLVAIDFPNGAMPSITSKVESASGGAYRYQYHLANLPQARQAIESVILAAPNPEALAQIRMHTASPQCKLSVSERDAAASGLSISVGSNGIAPGASPLEVGFDVPAKPGIIVARVSGQRKTAADIARLPEPVRKAIEKVERSYFPYVSVFTIGPKHPASRNNVLIAADYVAMINEAIRSDSSLDSPFLRELSALLNEYVRGAAPSDQDIEQMTFGPPVLTPLPAPKTAFDSAVQQALRLSVGLQ